ncbi:MAG: hypothetical protein LBU76_00910 [Azoarcus sp.]|jgi:hypothetical protein|nr:hypothetical protein [Azoarcus sp.]
MKKIFVNPETNKEWWIETEGLNIKTCLNNGKIKEIVCEDYQYKSKPASAMIAQMRKGFIYQNPQAKFGESICHQFVGRDNNGSWPIAASTEKEDFFITRIVGDFEDETLYHFDRDGNVLETISLGAKRMTYEQVLCSDDSILMNNSYLIERFSLKIQEITPFAGEKDNFKSMLDSKGDFVLWYTGTEIVVFDFLNNCDVWREKVDCRFGLLSPKHTKVAYCIEEQGYVIVNLKSQEKTLIKNNDGHPFFSPDDLYFSIGGKFYDSNNGKEISNPFPFTIKKGLTDYDIFIVKTCGNLIALQRDRGDSAIELWDYKSKEKVAEIDDVFIVRNASFEFTKSNLVVHTDYGAVSIYNCSE